MSHSFAISFHSGMSSSSDLRACINANVPVGVVAGLLTGLQKIMALPHYLDRGGKVFVDSGAFTAFRRNEPMNWNPVFWTYGVLIEGTDHPENLTIVAPDIIGNQDLSVALWEEQGAHQGVDRVRCQSGHPAADWRPDGTCIAGKGEGHSGNRPILRRHSLQPGRHVSRGVLGDHPPRFPRTGPRRTQR